MEGSNDRKPAGGSEFRPDRFDGTQGLHQSEHGGADSRQQLRSGINPPAEDHRVSGHPRATRRVLRFLDEPLFPQRVQRLHEENAEPLRAPRLRAF